MARIQEMKDNPQPTPPIGEPLVWYMAGDRKRAVAATCNGHEGPGRIKITIHNWQGMPMHRSACYYVDHPMHKKPNDTTRNNGSWDYPGNKIPKAHFEPHEQEIRRQEEAQIKADEDAKANALAFQKHKAEKEAGLRKRLPDILPAPVEV